MALTNQGTVVSICATPQVPTLNQAAFEALTFLPIPGAIATPSMRVNQNTLSQQTLAGGIASIQGGFINGETTDVEVEFSDATDPEIAALEAAAQSANLYAFKVELDNSLGANGTTFYGLCFVGGGGGLKGGGGEDFANRVYQITPSDQRPIEVAAA